jgi:hypothetical protein
MAISDDRLGGFDKARLVESAGNRTLGGLVTIVGALAYRSQKRRHLGLRSDSQRRRFVERAALVAVVALVVLQRDLLRQMVSDPTTNLLIPLWAILAYAIHALKGSPSPQPPAAL